MNRPKLLLLLVGAIAVGLIVFALSSAQWQPLVSCEPTIPDETAKWRLKLYCRREPTLLTKLFYKLLIKAKFKIDQTPPLVTIDMPP